MLSKDPVVAVACLSFEAKIAKGPNVTVLFGNSSNLARTLKSTVEKGCTGIISFGVAGGLSPALRPGDIVVASSVLSEQNRRSTDLHWSRNLLRVLPQALHGEILGVDAPVADAAHKLALHHSTGTVAVDMESHIAAEVASAHGLPFAACRVIIDPAERTLPPAALISLGSDGKADIPAVLRSLARKPQQIPSLLRIMSDAWMARTALTRARHQLGDGLGFPNFIERDTASPERYNYLRGKLSEAPRTA